MKLTTRGVDAGRSRLPMVHFVVDSAMWALAFPLSVWLRYDFNPAQLRQSLIGAIVLAIVLQGAFGLIYGQYRRRWRWGSFDEARSVAFTALSVGVVATVALWPIQSIPRSVPAMAAGLSLLGQLTARSLWRAFRDHRATNSADATSRVIVVGAGAGAVLALQMMRDSDDTPFVPVALIDDDSRKRNLRIAGVQVVGTTSDLISVAKRFNADSVLIAVPSASRSFVADVTADANLVGLSVFTLPTVERLFGSVVPDDIRPVDADELLGRQTVDIDSETITQYITGKRVMVTGAGGSIGRELCRILSGFSPSELHMLDRDESALHGTQLLLTGRALLDDPSVVLADIRDPQRVDEVFATLRPEVVFHTAALKHLPLLESYPDEGWKTNVVGTINLLKAAHTYGTKRFVNVSTDKAAAPTSVLGLTKRITERIAAWANVPGGLTCVSVRFGNVLGSNGSVLKAFEAQAAARGPITVTHPDVTRYFMTVSEAARLTVHAGGIGKAGEVMILDMGQPVRIIDVAKRFANRHQPPLDIEFTGLRPNEKLHEVLVSSDEVARCGVHPRIKHVDVPPLAADSFHLRSPSRAELEAIATRSMPEHAPSDAPLRSA